MSDKSKTSKRRRSRNPQKAESPRGAHSGRRGKKHRRQEQKLAKQKRVNEQESNEELQKRLALVSKIRPVIAELCSRSSEGVVVPHDVEDFSRDVLGQMYCPDGMVREGVVGLDFVAFDADKVIPWEQFTSYALKQIRKRRFRPFREKNILQIIADKL